MAEVIVEFETFVGILTDVVGFAAGYGVVRGLDRATPCALLISDDGLFVHPHEAVRPSVNEAKSVVSLGAADPYITGWER